MPEAGSRTAQHGLLSAACACAAALKPVPAAAATADPVGVVVTLAFKATPDIRRTQLLVKTKFSCASTAHLTGPGKTRELRAHGPSGACTVGLPRGAGRRWP